MSKPTFNPEIGLGQILQMIVIIGVAISIFWASRADVAVIKAEMKNIGKAQEAFSLKMDVYIEKTDSMYYPWKQNRDKQLESPRKAGE